MRIAALVPINTLSRAKSRLREELSDAERRQLVCWMAARVLRAVRASEVIETTCVISPDAAALRLAEENGAAALRQVRGGLNEGLELGRRWAVRANFDAVLVLLADLPLLTAQEVCDLVALGTSPAARRAVVFAPDRGHTGTNGMLLRPATGFPFAFGVHSLERHRALAHAMAIEPTVFESPGTRFDVDTLADLRILRERELWTPRECDAALLAAKGERL